VTVPTLVLVLVTVTGTMPELVGRAGNYSCKQSVFLE